MDQRISRLKSSQDARQLAENARRLGRTEVSTQALERARELQAIEEGYTSPAQIAIAMALYAYEEEQSRLKKHPFRANRTRQMLVKHGSLSAIERLVLHRRPSKGFEVLEEAGLLELSFEAIIARFPEEFSPVAVEVARARLKGEPIPSASRAHLRREPTGKEFGPAALDAEARIFLNSFRESNNRFMSIWLPRYRKTIQAIAKALSDGRPDTLFDTFWKSHNNSIAHAGLGMLSHAVVEEMRDELTQVILDIHEDESVENFNRITNRFEVWKDESRISRVPHLLIARVFSGVHPNHYHTTVHTRSQKEAIPWFVKHTGFLKPSSNNWAECAQALVSHLNRTKVFNEDILTRNIFPWFVVEQVRVREQLPSPSSPSGIPPGHTPRATSADSSLPPSQRHIVLRHNIVQTALFAQLVEQYGKDNVWTEYPTGTGGYADAITRAANGNLFLYEIKIADTAAEVVRQAMGQLLEYGFRAGGLKPVRLFAVGEPPLDDITGKFIALLRANFNLNIDYLQVQVPVVSVEN
ncbi:hypothetical protein [uncultured Herbaspirillum sp.]|uniref:hypothetical protein n=1 Tax=uncultured Herbaspirillum sp. TaxID=160236 RepID=UPI002590AE93|nr:hypothetical protein [uncultured Herbaspirillum sp.]